MNKVGYISSFSGQLCLINHGTSEEGKRMGEIIQFPKKPDFMSHFRGKIPEQILHEIAAAYDRAKSLLDEYPTETFLINEKDRSKAEKLIESQKEYTAKLLSRILELETEVILLRAKSRT